MKSVTSFFDENGNSEYHTETYDEQDLYDYLSLNSEDSELYYSEDEENESENIA